MYLEEIFMKYKDWLDQWLYLIKPTIKRCTYERYASIVKVHLKPYFGEYELDDLSARHIQELIAVLSEKYSPGTVNCIAFVVKHSLLSAEEAEIRKTRLNCKLRFRLRYKREMKCFTVANQKKLENYVTASDVPKLFGITVCLYTGLRVGELLALKWSDIDFKKAIIYVNSTCHDVYTKAGYQKLIVPPKTFTSKREIPLPKRIIPGLKELKKTSQSEFVISGKGGKVVSKRSYESTFSSVLKKLGLPHMGLHSLRHTFATRAIESGMDVKTLSEILGHSNAAITLNCYVHSLPEHKRVMMDKVGKNLH